VNEDALKLPSGISFRKERLSYGFAYVFREKHLGELGRMVVEAGPLAPL
jgi:hypothetical protein